MIEIIIEEILFWFFITIAFEGIFMQIIARAINHKNVTFTNDLMSIGVIMWIVGIISAIFFI